MKPPVDCRPTALPGVQLLVPERHHDARGWFMESWQQERWTQALGRSVHWIQDNHSRSHFGVMRGLHWQRAPFAQAKLVRCVAGTIWDVVVDVRPDSCHFGRWIAHQLDAENGQQLYIPEGFAHGFLVLSEVAEVLYKVNAPHVPTAECCLRWDDPALAIDWPLPVAVVSPKDQQGMDWATWLAHAG